MIPTNQQTSRFWRHWSCTGDPTWEFRPFWGRLPEAGQATGLPEFAWRSTGVRLHRGAKDRDTHVNHSKVFTTRYHWREA